MTDSFPTEIIHRQFLEYYRDFLRFGERAPRLFMAGQLEERLRDDLFRVQLYRSSIEHSAGSALKLLGDQGRDFAYWQRMRQRFLDDYGDELAATYFTSVMRKVFAPAGVPVEFPDDGIGHELSDPAEIVRRYPFHGRRRLGTAVRAALNDSVFSKLLGDGIDRDMEVIVGIIEEQLDAGLEVTSLDLLCPAFFRGKEAYLVGQLVSTDEPVPIVFCVVHAATGVAVDSVLVGCQATRGFLFSSSRSAFTVATPHYRKVFSFLQRLFPRENPGYIFDLIGFTKPAKISLLQQLREISRGGAVFHYLGTGPVDLVFGIKGFPLVLKVIKPGLYDRDSVIHNFRKVHEIDRLGQVLDSLLYRNLEFQRDRFSAEMIAKLQELSTEDVAITAERIVLKRVYASRRIVPLPQYLQSADAKEARNALLGVGWNIKHLAAMGFLPRSLELDHFGVTTWGRVVYLNNASLIDIQKFHFYAAGERLPAVEPYRVCPADFERDLNIPHVHRDMFRAVHGDLYLPGFWKAIKLQVQQGRHLDVFPYPTRCRLGSRRFRKSVLEELHRLGTRVNSERIQVVQDTLAVVDAELAGLDFLRLEVPHPSARVLVVEPIGPDIIAHLHARFQDVTFDILQSESELVENDGQWRPGIRGKLKELVQVRRYDYVIGYVNETFDADFFRLARLKGMLLLSTGTHNIDLAAATACHTVVTNAPGPTTTTVAEQNIGLILDTLCPAIHLRGEMTESDAAPGNPVDGEALAPVASQLLWLALLRRTLKLDEMFAFGTSHRYVRTGVGEQTTVYHDQIGQNREAGISRSLAVIGLNETGIRLIELAIAHEVSRIHVLDNEYERLSPDARARIDELTAVIRAISQVEAADIRIVPLAPAELFARSDYLLNTDPANAADPAFTPRPEQILIEAKDILVRDLPRLRGLAAGTLTLGIQGLGRIGEAVAQRAMVLGMNIFVYQKDPAREKYRLKRQKLLRLAAHRKRWTGQSLGIEYARDKDDFFRGSNIVTTLAATTEGTRRWVDADGLARLAGNTSSPMRAIVSAGKGLVDEDALVGFLRQHPDAEARLDVLVAEHEGGAYLKLTGLDGTPLRNVKVTGHTAAAVREVRQLKIFKALDNLRNLIDGRIPPNIVNNAGECGKSNGSQSIVEIEGLKFFRMEACSPRARVLVIEPLAPEIALYLQHHFDDTSFDILLAESELVEVDGHWLPGINARLNAIVGNGDYDYCLGYCNANFDASFFERARLKGLMLFATATHHIDFSAATRMGTLVTNAPGFTTVAVTEQNVGMVLDSLYGRYVQEYQSEAALSLNQLETFEPQRARTVAQILWYLLLRKALRLDAMYRFGSGDKYVRTGVRRDATIYHDQLGQCDQAGICNSIAVIGLDETGLNLIELALAHELSVVYLLADEYAGLSPQVKSRLREMSETIHGVTQTRPFATRLLPVTVEELSENATYTIKTPAAYRDHNLAGLRTKSAIAVCADKVFVNDPGVFERGLVGLTLGVQGLGRIGEAMVQRMLAFGADVKVQQRDPERPKYRQKQERLNRLAQNRTEVYGRRIGVEYVDKETFFRTSNIVTTLAATTAATRHWVDRHTLELFGSEARGEVRVLVNAGKGLLNEADLAPYLRERPDVEVRLDVLSDEQAGKAGQRFTDRDGRPLANLKIAGHTAAAVPELRRLKICHALNNLRLHMDGGSPGDILNPEVTETLGNEPGNPGTAQPPGIGNLTVCPTVSAL